MISSNNLVIFCDTCLFFKNPKLTNEFWTKVKTIIKSINENRLIITKPLQLEINKKLLEIHEKELTSFKSLATKSKLTDLSSKLEKEYSTEKEDFIINYFSNFIKTVFTHQVVIEEKFPEVRLEDIFMASLKHSKPFNIVYSKGGYSKTSDGLRDFTIWISVVEYINNIPSYKKKDLNFIFCTENTTDFANTSNLNLHSDFYDRLKALGIKEENFKLVHKHEQLDIYIDEYSDKQRIIKHIQNSPDIFNLDIIKIESVIHLNFDHKEHLPHCSGKEFMINLDLEHEPQFGRMFQESDKIFILEGTIKFDFYVSFEVPRQDAYEAMDHEPADWHITEIEAGDDYAWASTYVITDEYHFQSKLEINREGETVKVKPLDFQIEGQNIIDDI